MTNHQIHLLLCLIWVYLNYWSLFQHRAPGNCKTVKRVNDCAAPTHSIHDLLFFLSSLNHGWGASHKNNSWNDYLISWPSLHKIVLHWLHPIDLLSCWWHVSDQFAQMWSYQRKTGNWKKWAVPKGGIFRDSERFNVTNRLIWAEKPTASNRKYLLLQETPQMKETGQSCSIIPLTDNRTMFGTTFFFFFFFLNPKQNCLITDVSFWRFPTRQKAENTDTSKSRAHAYLIWEQSWGFVGEFAPLSPLPLLLVAPHWSLCVCTADLHARNAPAARWRQDVTVLYTEDEGNVLFSPIGGGGDKQLI